MLHRVIGLFGDMDLEGEDLGVGIVDVARRMGDHRGLGGIDLVAKQVAVSVVPVEPRVGRLYILFVDKVSL